jgi:hypothetical protein
VSADDRAAGALPSSAPGVQVPGTVAGGQEYLGGSVVLWTAGPLCVVALVELALAERQPVGGSSPVLRAAYTVRSTGLEHREPWCTSLRACDTRVWAGIGYPTFI